MGGRRVVSIGQAPCSEGSAPLAAAQKWQYRTMPPLLLRCCLQSLAAREWQLLTEGPALQAAAQKSQALRIYDHERGQDFTKGELQLSE
ncbi:hypothetical protein UY3_00471 [Chelonia mydas]|uniref:Uncharacterized protein n=1 Tax=Chelonia mydas TaxID=8469 RepID=M7BYP2_CHEMY|nr:hypothetical protein UY3_00471 [Chelonia mydas]